MIVPNSKIKNDLFYTPDFLAKKVVNHFNPSGKILEPCFGKGAFYNSYPNDCEKEWCEIEMGVDFMNYNKKVD